MTHFESILFGSLFGRGVVCNYTSWLSRGWCRLELWCRLLSNKSDTTVIVLHSATEAEFMCLDPIWMRFLAFFPRYSRFFMLHSRCFSFETPAPDLRNFRVFWKCDEIVERWFPLKQEVCSSKWTSFFFRFYQSYEGFNWIGSTTTLQMESLLWKMIEQWWWSWERWRQLAKSNICGVAASFCVVKVLILEQGSVNYLFWGDQTIQIYGNFEGSPLWQCIVWVGNIMTPEFGGKWWYFEKASPRVPESEFGTLNIADALSAWPFCLK